LQHFVAGGERRLARSGLLLMAELGTFLADHRRRNLAILAGGAAISVLLAVLALREQAAELAPKYTHETFFPGVAPEIKDATKIHIVSQKGSFDVIKNGSRWVIPQRSNYSASFEQIQKTLVGIAAFETIEPKTSRPDWFHYVDLDMPPKGNGILFAVTGNDGHEIASVIVGKSEDIGDPSGALGLFVRRPTDNQSWLVRSVFEPRSDPGDWMDKNVVSVDRARIQEVDVTPSSGPAYVVRRDKPSDPDFRPTSVPRGRELSSEAAGDTVAAAITGFAFDDIRQAKSFDFSGATRHVTKTFDGLTVTADTVQQGSDYWTTLSAAAGGVNPDVQNEAADLNARASGWAYKLPAYKGQQFMATLESLLKPSGTPAKTDQ
jgi:hypothetical protein